MFETMKRICALQPRYSHENTIEMQERGRLIRQVLPSEIRGLEPELGPALGKFRLEFSVGASDGIGRKTEAPWVRIFATNMSPTPRSGYYVVLHFAANGQAAFVTIGCGSTIFLNGELKSESDEELARRTEWARKIIVERFGSLEPFSDQIELGARALLPKTFEKATACSHRIAAADLSELNEGRLRELLVRATQRLQAIYIAQQIGRDLTAAQAVEIVVEQITNPGQRRRPGQGFGLTTTERRIVELHAMSLATTWLEAVGFVVEDRSATSSFDLLATNENGCLKVEVKGTTSDTADTILMTYREVELHRRERGSTGLIVVSGIRLVRTPSAAAAEGGVVRADLGWDVDAWEAQPIAFTLTRRAV